MKSRKVIITIGYYKVIDEHKNVEPVPIKEMTVSVSEAAEVLITVTKDNDGWFPDGNWGSYEWESHNMIFYADFNPVKENEEKS